MHLTTLSPLVAATALLLLPTSTNASPQIMGHFTVQVALNPTTNCTRPHWDQMTCGAKKHRELVIKQGECHTFDEFRTLFFGYKHGAWFQGNPKAYGLCNVRAFAGEKCEGKEILKVEEANRREAFHQCYSEEFKDVPGRSVKVDKCRPRPKPKPPTKEEEKKAKEEKKKKEQEEKAVKEKKKQEEKAAKEQKEREKKAAGAQRVPRDVVEGGNDDDDDDDQEEVEEQMED